MKAITVPVGFNLARLQNFSLYLATDITGFVTARCFTSSQYMICANISYQLMPQRLQLMHQNCIADRKKT